MKRNVITGALFAGLATMAKSYLYPLFFVITICFAFVSCRERNCLFENGESITFQNLQGALFVQGFSINGDDYFVFKDFKTKKNISIYDNQGKCCKSISIDSITKTYGYFKRCFVTENDIYLIGEYNNQIVVIDENGKMKRHFDFSDLRKSKGLELWPPINVKDSILYASTMSFNLNTGRNLADCIMVSCDMMSNTPSPRIFIDSFYSRFLNQECFTIEFKNYEVTDSFVIVTSVYSDSIYVFDFNGNIHSAVPVVSKYFQTKAPTVSEKLLEINEDTINGNLRVNSHINYVIYDKYRKVYYCIISGPQNKNGTVPFSIIVYDCGFKIITERLFNDIQYSAYGLCFYVSKKGLYLSKKTNNNEVMFCLYELLQNE